VSNVSALSLLCDQARQRARDAEDQLEATESQVQAMERLLGIALKSDADADDDDDADADLGQRRKAIVLKIRQLKRACKVSQPDRYGSAGSRMRCSADQSVFQPSESACPARAVLTLGS
jgi:hypothetical protein